MKAKRIVVIGIGNILVADEGVGVHAIKELEKLTLPENIKVYDCGTGGMRVLDALEGAEKAIIIDAVKAGGKPGDVYRFTLDEIVRKDRGLKIASLHELDFITAVKIAGLTEVYKLPKEVVIIGVEPKSIEEMKIELSPEVEEVMPKVIKAVLEEIKGA